MLELRKLEERLSLAEKGEQHLSKGFGFRGQFGENGVHFEEMGQGQKALKGAVLEETREVFKVFL